MQLMKVPIHVAQGQPPTMRANEIDASKAQQTADWMHVQQSGARQHEVRGAS